MRRLVLIGVLLPLLAACGSGGSGRPIVVGDPSRGHDLIVHYGCGACHRVPGVQGANGHVGPSLHGLPDRPTIAGTLPNTPRNAVRWIVDPQRFVPGNDMPVLGLTRAEARDVVAYLYSR